MRKISLSLMLITFLICIKAQVVINEASNRNFTQVSDADGDQHDWFELFNTDSTDISLLNWSISDKRSMPRRWIFPNIILKSNKQLLVFASGLNIIKVNPVDHWESAILPSDTFNYCVPSNITPNNWNTSGYNLDSWKKGIAGFGFSGNDDSTIIDFTSLSVYIRRDFDISDTASISDAILHVDYEDGFVAYLNGTEIARAGIDGDPTWNSLANRAHSAVMFEGRIPEKFELDMSLIRSIWKQSNNVFAIEAHDKSAYDGISLIPFLSFGISNNKTLFKPVPKWFKGYTGSPLHTNFKIDSKGETIYLSSPDSVIADSLVIPRIPLNSSFGRVTDGDKSLGIFLNASPGTSNNKVKAFTNGYEPTPKLSIPAGFYNASVSVSITDSSTTAEIRYTTDGSEPTETSTLFNGAPVAILSTQTLKAKCFSTGNKLPGKTVTATYFIKVSHKLPVISITTNDENLYGKSGIFDNPMETWNKPCYVEYFDTIKQLGFKMEAGLQIDGGLGGSRIQAQHSIRVEPGNGTFGEGNAEYKLIPDRPNRNKYSSFYLRNGSNQYGFLQYKDAIEVKAMGKNNYNYYSAHTPVVAYINGRYFGVYELREKLNAEYFSRNYLMDNDSLDELSITSFAGPNLRALAGSTDQFWKDYNHFKELNALDKTYLEQVSKFLDLDNYTDYMIAELWIANDDWPTNNILVFRNKSTGYKWRYVLQDLEKGLNPNGSDATMDPFIFIRTDIPHIDFFMNLINNIDYKIYFINRFADLMNTNYLFSNIGLMEEEMYNLQYPEMQANFAKWKNSTMADFEKNHNILRSQFEIRSGYVREYIQSFFNLTYHIEVTLDVKPVGAGQIKISTVVPVNYPWSGIYFSDNPVKVTALPNPGYKFTGWDNNPLITKTSQTEFIAKLKNTKESFIANFETSNEAFKGITLSEIHYKNGVHENSTDWLEILNAGDSKVNLDGWYITNNDSLNKFVFSKNENIDANSRLVVARDNKIFSLKYPDISNYTGPLNFKLDSPEDAVRLYDNAKTLIAEVNYSDFYPWPLNGDETGRTLELRNSAGNLNDPYNWFAGCVGGSPGNAYSQCKNEVGIELLAKYKSFLSVYPNPANDNIGVSINLQKRLKNCRLKIYNMFGTEVKSVNLGNIEVGIYNSNINISKMPAGFLFLQFQSDNKEESIKIIHLKHP